MMTLERTLHLEGYGCQLLQRHPGLCIGAVGDGQQTDCRGGLLDGVLVEGVGQHGHERDLVSCIMQGMHCPDYLQGSAQTSILQSTASSHSL